MKIAINSVAAFKEERTGVEEYAYQLIKYFAQIDSVNQFVLYKSSKQVNDLGFELPTNFKVKSLVAPFLWSQIRLALEMQNEKPDVLFVPAQVAPFFCVKNSVVTVHGLEYEYFPQQYPLWFRYYLRFFTKHALRNARKVIAVSENTKNDLVKLYGGDASKIEVIWHGVENELRIMNQELRREIRMTERGLDSRLRGNDSQNVQQDATKYFLYIGRIETKKNLVNLVKAFELFKTKYQLSHQLVLIGGKGYGWQEVYKAISQSKYQNDMVLTGFLPATEKMDFLRGAELFIFVSFYEGFGMPVLEAMAVGTPVLASNNSSLPEVCGGAVILVAPQNIAEIADSMYNIISKEDLRKSLIQKGFENVKRFSWEKCARQTLEVIKKCARE